MRHRKRGRVLSCSPSHRKALFRNLVKALILTEDPEPSSENAPKIKGRIITTLPKAKEVRSMAEKVITVAKKGLIAEEAAKPFATTAKRNSEEWKKWRESDQHNKWVVAMQPAVNARRRVVQMLAERGDAVNKGDKKAVRILFTVIAPRFKDRDGGYTRVLKLAKPRLGDAGARAVLEYVGRNDRVKKADRKAAAPKFEGGEATSTEAAKS